MFGHENRDARHDRTTADVRGQHHRAPGDPVHHHAAEQQQSDGRHQPGRQHDRQSEGAAVNPQRLQRKRNGEHAVADHGDGLARPQKREVSMPQSGGEMFEGSWRHDR